MIKQFIPQDYCLKCKNCCRFKDENSVWLPCLLDEEIDNLMEPLGLKPEVPQGGILERPLSILALKGKVFGRESINRKDIPAVSMTNDKRIHPIPNSNQKDLICPFLDLRNNKCKIYDFRPFECQLYPFLINLRGKKIILTEDLNCPYLKENLNSEELKEYIDYLSSFLNSPPQLRLLKDNPQILQAYEEVSEVIELKLSDEVE